MVSCYWAIKLAACISRIRQPQLQGLMTKSRWSVAEWVQRTLLFCFGTTNVSVLSVFAKHMFISTHMCSTLPGLSGMFHDSDHFSVFCSSF
jgi:hypothetical protein